MRRSHRVAPAAPAERAEEMVWIPGGTFLMGSNHFYPEERPVHHATVDGFWMDAHPVTVDAFRRFANDTGYVTVAERVPDPVLYAGVDRSLLVPGSLVFRKPPARVPLHDVRAWWCYLPGACWHHPEGPESTIAGRGRHPVTHVSYEDALAYASWAGKALPTETEWERAARGGLEGAAFVWGNELAPDGRMMANSWQGEFPWQNLVTDGYEGTSPVGVFPPNGYGLYDMAGNVWEWTCDLFAPHHASRTGAGCCAPPRPRADDTHAGHAAAVGITRIAQHVLKGGSHLCAPNYCLRYRPAARQPQAVDSSACHIGFRCIVRSAGDRRPPTRARR